MDTLCSTSAKPGCRRLPRTWVVVVGAGSWIEADAVDDLARVQAVDRSAGVELIEVDHPHAPNPASYQDFQDRDNP